MEVRGMVIQWVEGGINGGLGTECESKVLGELEVGKVRRKCWERLKQRSILNGGRVENWAYRRCLKRGRFLNWFSCCIEANLNVMASAQKIEGTNETPCKIRNSPSPTSLLALNFFWYEGTWHRL